MGSDKTPPTQNLQNVIRDAFKSSTSATEEGQQQQREQQEVTEEAAAAPEVDVLDRCIRRNNDGLDLLMHGRLHEAQSAFFDASNIHRRASYHPSYDADRREYQSHWTSVRHIVDAIATSEQMKRTMNHIFLFGLRIGGSICDNSRGEQQEGDDEDGQYSLSNIDVLCTARIDWTIGYNIGLVTQLLGIVTTNVWGTIYRANSIDGYEQLSNDIVAWYDGMAPLDAAVLMMALHNNQGTVKYFIHQETNGYLIVSHTHVSTRRRSDESSFRAIAPSSLSRKDQHVYNGKQLNPAA
eukprot:scaffold22578_cov164-Cylindrotheca_fusiformis.AAC.16